LANTHFLYNELTRINFFDLHCDTLFESFSQHKNLFDSAFSVNFKKISNFKNYTGCFAIWIPNNLKGKNAFDFFKKVLTNFKVQKKKYSKFLNENNINIILTVEGGYVLGSDLSKIKILKSENIKILTLTWNCSCEIGDGCDVINSSGLTKFGKQVVTELENNDIIIDVSHASEALFYDVCDTAKKPFIATHSNSKNVYNHKRNITDEQFKIIRQNKGLVGINFCKNFLNDPDKSNLEDIFLHIEKFLSLSGESSICIGSDFDGAETIEEIKDVCDISKLYNFLLKKNYKESLVKKIFFENAKNFFN